MTSLILLELFSTQLNSQWSSQGQMSHGIHQAHPKDLFLIHQVIGHKLALGYKQVLSCKLNPYDCFTVKTKMRYSLGHQFLSIVIFAFHEQGVRLPHHLTIITIMPSLGRLLMPASILVVIWVFQVILISFTLPQLIF